MANGDAIETLPNDPRLHPVIAELLKQIATKANTAATPGTVPPTTPDSPPAPASQPPVRKAEAQPQDRSQGALDFLNKIIAGVPSGEVSTKRTKADLIGAFLNPVAAGFGAAMATPHRRNANRAFWGNLVGTGVPSAFNYAELPKIRQAQNIEARQKQLKSAADILKAMTPLAREESLEPVQSVDAEGNQSTIYVPKSQAAGRTVGARPSGVNPAKSAGAIIEITGPNNELIGTYNKVNHQGWHMDGTPFTPEELRRGEAASGGTAPASTIPPVATNVLGQPTADQAPAPTAGLQQPAPATSGQPATTAKKATPLFGRRGQARPPKPVTKQEWLPDPNNPKQEVLTNIEDGKITTDVTDAKGKSRVRPSPLSRYETEAMFRKSLKEASGDAASKADARKGEAFDVAKKVLDWAQSHDSDPDGTQRKLLKSQHYDDNYIEAQLGPSLKDDPVALYKKGIEGIYQGATTDKAKAAIPMVERYMYDQLNLRFRNLTPDQRKAMLEMMMGGGGMPTQ